MSIAFRASMLSIKAIIVFHIPALIDQPAGSAAEISEAVQNVEALCHISVAWGMAVGAYSEGASRAEGAFSSDLEGLNLVGNYSTLHWGLVVHYGLFLRIHCHFIIIVFIQDIYKLLIINYCIYMAELFSYIVVLLLL